MKVRVAIPRNKPIRQKIYDYYVNLFIGYKRENPNGKYSHRKMLSYAQKAMGIVRWATVDTDSLIISDYNEWASRGYYQIKIWNWYYAFILVRKRGKIFAEVQDVHHMNDHHNDKMQTQPYNESKHNSSIILSEAKLRQIISESIKKVLYN